MKKVGEPFLNRYRTLRLLDHGVIHSAKTAVTKKDNVVLQAYTNQYAKTKKEIENQQ